MEPGKVSRFDPIARFVLAGFESGTVQRYAFAIATVAIAAALRGGASFLSERALLFPTFYPAVLAATLFGGIRPGILASLASVVVVWVAFMARDSLLDIPDSDQLFNMCFFGAMALLLVWIAASYRGLIEKLRAEDDRRNLMVMEMQHRNRNTLAVAQAIVSQGLKDDRDSQEHQRALECIGQGQSATAQYSRNDSAVRGDRTQHSVELRSEPVRRQRLSARAAR